MLNVPIVVARDPSPMLNHVLSDHKVLHLYMNLALDTTKNKAISIGVTLRWPLSSLARRLQTAILRAPHEIPANATAGLGAVVIMESGLNI